MNPEFERRLLHGVSPKASPISLSPTTSTPSPNKERYADRFIPNRSRARWHIDFNLSADELYKQASRRQTTSLCNTSQKENIEDKDSTLFHCLLSNELLGAQIDNPRQMLMPAPQPSESTPFQSPTTASLTSVNSEQQRHLSPLHNRLFRYRIGPIITSRSPRLSNTLCQSNRQSPAGSDDPVMQSLTGSPLGLHSREGYSPYSLSSLSDKSEKLLRSPRKTTRKISRIPYKVLDAPDLQDDFYLNLVDWSLQNVLSVGLGSCVYLWSANTSQVTKLCDLSTEGDVVTAVSWGEKARLMAIGTNKGLVQIWDITAAKKIHELEGHEGRVGTVAWNGEIVSSGSRDHFILHRDLRSASTVRRLTGHRQEVCGLKWSPDYQHLASGGNDNRLHLWTLSNNQPVQTFSDHSAAVKAIAWSPHQHGLLASGGGTADRHIRFWNTLTGQSLHSIDTGSQVCNLAWSRHTSEMVSTHGYSQHQIVVWTYPKLQQIAKLTGHNCRVLYLATSPDGENIVTGAGDETLRFWSVFSKPAVCKEHRSLLNLSSRIR